MRKVYLELTNRCNLNCIMCYRNSWETELIDMDEATLRKVAAMIDPNVTVVFGGIGEPTYAKHFELACELFKNHRLELTTNGVLSEAKLKQVCENFDNVIISVDGTEDTYFHIRKTDFKHVYKTL